MINLSAAWGLTGLGAHPPWLFALIVVVVMVLEGLLLASAVDLVRRIGRARRRRLD